MYVMMVMTKLTYLGHKDLNGYLNCDWDGIRDRDRDLDSLGSGDGD